MAFFEVVRTQIEDGLAVFSTPDGGHLPTAGLTFRAARADETAATSGLSHIVEHLILPARSGGLVDYNGYVDNLVTNLFATGRAEDLRAFLASTAALVRQLPIERFEVERRILLAEQAMRPANAVRQALALRFGPVGAGLSGYDEYGLRRLRAEEVVAWAEARFTRENAILWVAGIPPDELEVLLPAGDERHPCPETRQIDDLRTPSVYDAYPGTGICLSFLAPRSALTGVTRDVLTDALLDRLRYEHGLSYSIESDTQAVSHDATHLVVSADVDDSSVPEWLEHAIGVIDDLAVSGPSEETLEHGRQRRRRFDEDPASASSWVMACAEWELQGLAFQTHEEFTAEGDAATPDDIARVIASIHPSLLVVGPETTPVPDGFDRYPLSSSQRVSGRRHRPGNLRARLSRSLRLVELQSSPEGVSAVSPNGDVATAIYDRTVLCMHEPGTRTLLTDDGFFVTVSAEWWTGGNELLAEIDAAIPPERVVYDDPVSAEHTAEVERLARETFKRTWLVSEELQLLPHVLEDGESLLALARASHGWRLGLLALTDRRLHFLYGDGSKHSFAVDRRPLPVRVDGSTLEFQVDDGWVSLTDVQPKEMAVELARMLDEWSANGSGA